MTSSRPSLIRAVGEGRAEGVGEGRAEGVGEGRAEGVEMFAMEKNTIYLYCGTFTSSNQIAQFTIK